MNVLITGGAGFIGSHLAERFLADKWRVTVIDDLSTGSLSNVAGLRANPHFSCYVGSVCDSDVITPAVREADLVVHLAAVVGVRLAVNEPIRTIRTNVLGTENVLAAAVARHTRVIVASTSEVYGKHRRIPFVEDMDVLIGNTTTDRWSYACSKALDEFLGLAYWKHWGVPVTVVRFFNAVGPRQTGRYGMVLPTLVDQALGERPMTVFGTGKQKRCFAYVGDVLEAMARIARADGVIGEVINIGNDSEISINQLACLIKRVTGSASEIVHLPYDVAYGPGFEDMCRRVPSLKKLERLIGYRPTTPIEAIVESVVQSRALRATAA
jgi:nucleoside-diphosphate-sugar epimerase